MVFQRVDSLSGGERSRTALARLASQDPNFLILDEPTNHLDLWACDSLERALLNFDGTVLFVSHDRYFLNRVADHILVVEPDRFRVLEGNYETYVDTVRRRAAENAAEAPGERETSKKSAATEADAAKKDRRKRKFPFRKTADIEADIQDREAKVEELQAKMILPETLRDGRLVKQIQADIEQHRAALTQLYEHWEEAAELNP
jgi:ATP-binding cassette subfamily F protein 3